MDKIDIYSKSYCPFCKRAIKLLEIKGTPYNIIDVTNDQALEEEMFQRAGHSTVPQIFIGGYHIGGCDNLFALDEQGELDELLFQVNA